MKWKNRPQMVSTFPVAWVEMSPPVRRKSLKIIFTGHVFNNRDERRIVVIRGGKGRDNGVGRNVASDKRRSTRKSHWLLELGPYV